MPSLAELRDTRFQAAGEIKRLGELVKKEGRDFNTEERSSWDKANAEWKSAGDQIAIQEQAALVAGHADASNMLPGNENDTGSIKSRRRSRAIPEASDLDTALRGWFARGRRVDDRTVAASKRCGINLRGDSVRIRLGVGHGLQTRAQSVGTNTAGGYLRPDDFIPTLEKAMLHNSGVLQACDVITTRTGNAFKWPTIDDTANDAAALAENTAAADGPDLVFGQFTLNAWQMSSGVVLVSYQLERDSEIPLGPLIGQMFGERIGRKSEEWGTTGAGTTEPTGIVTSAILGHTCDLTNAIAPDDLLELEYSVNKVYRDAPGAGYMMSDEAAKEVRRLTDDNGRPLWDDGLRGGQPETLKGKPLYTNTAMAGLTAGASPIVFGDLKAHKVRRVGEVVIVRLAERYREKNQIGYVAFAEMDSNTLNAGTGPIKRLKMAS